MAKSKGQRDTWKKPKVVQKYRWGTCWKNEAETGSMMCREVPPNCADSAKQESSTVTTAFKLFQPVVQKGPSKITVTIVLVTHLKENMCFAGWKINPLVGLCLSGEAQQRQAGLNPSPKINLLLCFSCLSSNVQPVGCKGDSLMPLVTGCRGLLVFAMLAVGILNPSLRSWSC